MLAFHTQRRLTLQTGLDFYQREKRWRMSTAKGVAEMSGTDQKVNYGEIQRVINACIFEIKTRLRLYDLIDSLEFANNPEQLVPWLYCYSQQQARYRHDHIKREAIEAGILAGEAVAAAAILTKYVEVPTTNAASN